MNVIIMGNFLYPEGMAGTKRIQHLADYLKRHGIEIKILLLRQGGSNTSHKGMRKHEGIEYITIGRNLRFNSQVFRKLPKYMWKGSFYICKWKKTNSQNILYVYGGPNIENIWFIMIAKILQFKVVFDIVEDHEKFNEKLHILSKLKLISSLYLQRIIRCLSDGIVVISHHLYNKYLKIVGSSIPLCLIPITAVVREDQQKYCFNDPIRLIYSGSFAKKDGVEHLIDAFLSLYRKNKDINLLLTGKGDPKNIKRILKYTENSQGIKFLGYLDDFSFYSFLDKADILCMIRTKSEFANAGFPFKLGEYLATGNPVIASEISDIPKYFETEKDLILVPPGDVKKIEQAINYLISDQSRAYKIGISGKNKCRRYFNPETNGKKLLNLIEIISKPRINKAQNA